MFFSLSAETYFVFRFAREPMWQSSIAEVLHLEGEHERQNQVQSQSLIVSLTSMTSATRSQTTRQIW